MRDKRLKREVLFLLSSVDGSLHVQILYTYNEKIFRFHLAKRMVLTFIRFSLRPPLRVSLIIVRREIDGSLLFEDSIRKESRHHLDTINDRESLLPSLRFSVIDHSALSPYRRCLNSPWISPFHLVHHDTPIVPPISPYLSASSVVPPFLALVSVFFVSSGHQPLYFFRSNLERIERLSAICSGQYLCSGGGWYTEISRFFRNGACSPRPPAYSSRPSFSVVLLIGPRPLSAVFLADRGSY